MPGRISAALRSLLVLAVLFYGVTRASAHPAPFSYLDIVFRDGGIEGTLVIHVIDAAHDLNITPFERLMENAVAESSRQAIAANYRLTTGYKCGMDQSDAGSVAGT